MLDIFRRRATKAICVSHDFGILDNVFQIAALKMTLSCMANTNPFMLLGTYDFSSAR